MERGGLRRLAEALGERHGAGVEVGRDLVGGAAQGLAGAGGTVREAMLEGVGGDGQGRLGLLGAPVEPLDEVAALGVEGRGEAAERLLDAALGLGGALAHQGGDALACPVEVALQAAAVSDQHLLDAPDRLLEAGGEVGTAHAERLRRVLDQGREVVAHPDRPVAEGGDDAVAGAGEPGLGLGRAGADRRGDAGAGLLDLLAQRDAAIGDMRRDGAAGGGEALGDAGAGLGEALGEVGAAGEEALLEADGRTLEGLADLRAFAVEGLDHAGTGLRERAGDLAGILGQRPGQQAAGALERLRHLDRATLEGAAQGFSDAVEIGLHALAGGDEPLDEVVAAAGHGLDHPLARGGERHRDRVAPLAERGGDRLAAGPEGVRHPLARAVDRGDDPLGCGVELLGQVLMRALDRAAHPLGIGDDRFALGHQLVDEGADADLVVRVRALKGRDLAADQGLELAGPRQRPLDAVADRRDLAADRLGHGQDRIGGKTLRLGEADRHLADGARDEAHLLGAHRQHRGDVEQHHRGEHRRGADGALEAGQPGGKAAQVPARLRPGERGEAREPEERGEAGDGVGGAGGLDPQSLLQGTDAAAVVVGDERAVGRQQPAVAAAVARAGQGAAVEGRLAPGGGEGVGIVHVGQARLDPAPLQGPVEGAGVRRPGLLTPGRMVQVQGLLNRRQRRFRRILELLFRRHRTPRYAVNAAGRPSRAAAPHHPRDPAKPAPCRQPTRSQRFTTRTLDARSTSGIPGRREPSQKA